MNRKYVYFFLILPLSYLALTSAKINWPLNGLILPCLEYIPLTVPMIYEGGGSKQVKRKGRPPPKFSGNIGPNVPAREILPCTYAKHFFNVSNLKTFFL